jgi:predicted nuclease with TOPRIM domain
LPPNESNNGSVYHIGRIDELEANDGKIAQELAALNTEVAVLNTKFDGMKETLTRIENILEERPSRLELNLQQKQIDSIRSKSNDTAIKHYAKIGGFVVGGFSALEVWHKLHSIIAPLLGL